MGVAIAVGVSVDVDVEVAVGSLRVGVAEGLPSGDPLVDAALDAGSVVANLEKSSHARASFSSLLFALSYFS